MALTPDELRHRIANWSLESDGQLLQYMVSIAKNIEDKCSKTRDNLNSLMLQVNQTEVKLATATNQFSAVEQVKFVENRVEEDDESFYGLRRRRQQVDEPRKDTQQEDGDERTMDDLIQLAVERSIEGMYKSYEKVTLQLTDSESSDDDDLPTNTRLTDPAELTAGKATIMRAAPKYTFIERPLPHVIGSKEWQNKWHVGLIDSEDESSSDRKEEYSESPSETDDGGMFPSQPNSKNHTPSESESSIWGAEGRKRAPSMDPSVTGDEGSSVYSYASSSKVPRPLPVVAARGISSEGARLKPPSLFPEEPPEEDVRRRGERGLFDDSPEEDEPTPMPTPQPRQAMPTMNDTTKSFFKGNSQQPARKIVNLFDDEPPEPLPDSLPVPEQKKTINLFIESEDDEEQVKENVRNNNVTSATEKRRVEEVTAKQSLKPAGPALTNPRAMTKLVDELNNNFRRQQEQPAPEKTKPVPEDNSRARSSVTNIFDDEPPIDDFDRLFNAANPTAKPAIRQTILPQPTARVEKEKKPINLFAEDDEDDYDGIVVGSNETRPQKSPSQGSYVSPGRSMLPKPAERLPTVKKKSIFDESDSEEGTNDADSDLFASTTKKAPTVMPPVQIPKAAPKVTKSIFSDSSEAEDDDDEALFGKSSSILKNKLDALKKNGGAAGRQEVGATSKPESKPASKSKSLFDEDSEEDAQDVKKDDDLLGSVSKPAAPLALDKKTVKPAQKVSLFDDEPPSDDDDALFGQSRRKVETQPSSVEATQKEGISSNASESVGPIATNSIVDLFTKTEPSASASVPKQSLNNSEQLNSQPAVKENPVESNSSIRSLILKKSIFNSDSESEEDDSIFGAVAKSSEKLNVSKAEPKVSAEIEKSELNHAKETPRQTNDDVPTIEAKQSIEKEAIVVEEPKSNVNENGDNSIAQNTLESVNHVDKDEPSSIQNVLRAPVDVPVQIPVDPKTSIFDNPTSENEADHGSGDSITHQKSELTPQPKASDENISFVPTLEPSGSDNVLQEDDAPLPIAKAEETSDTSETPHTKLPVPDEGTLADETPNGMMIANDIDYYLHTNEPSKDGSEKLSSIVTPAMDRPPAPVTPPAGKSEPKSALNFSPIGLFDDVPPPDDGDETDDVTHPKQSASVESTLPPILDEASSYSQESQSLDFIPSGSAGGNRSRYLFDDEPPPDEADDSSANPSFSKPSAFKVGSAVVKGLFDNPAPASLPPMVEDSRSESSKPIRPKVNKLNAKLAINVAALLPGARRPMPASSSPEKQLASTVTSVSKGTPETTAKPAQSEEAPNSGKLTGLNKGRARIPTKRKPPSRQTLRAGSLGSSLQSSVSEEERNEKDPPQSSAADDRIVVGSEGKVEHVEAGLPPQDSFPPANHSTVSSKVEIKRIEDPFVDRLSASVRNPSKRVVLPDGNDGDKPPVTATAKKTTVKPSNTSLFGDSDGEGDDDDFFSTLPTKGVVIKKEATKRAAQPKPVGSKSIFGSDDEDEADGGEDDLFGTKKSSIAGQLKAKVLDVSASQAAGARKEKKSLFDDDDDDGDDDDDIFGSKSKTISKVNSHQHQANPVGRSSLPTVTKPMTTTTSPADDPLADLLADS